MWYNFIITQEYKIIGLQIVNSKNAQSFYVVKSIYKNKKRSNKVVQKLGTLEEVKIKAGDSDPVQRAKDYVKKLNEEEKNGTRKILINYASQKIIGKASNVFLIQVIYF